MTAKKHKTIPIFVPHLGCPHDCIFCNQRSITGVESFDISRVRQSIDDALSTIDPACKPEIAFFGGSFTGIDQTLMIGLLEIANDYIDKGLISSIRCSTRPDYIDDEKLDILKKYNLKTIELGVQSMSDGVLIASNRGHTADQTRSAVKKIIAAGFDFVGQMMIGLPASESADELECARFIASSGAVGARIYPTVVFAKTGLEALMRAGKYPPLTVEDAARRSADVAEILIDANIKLLRIGLCESDGLHATDGAVGGAIHPALGELCATEIYRRKICLAIERANICEGSNIEIKVPRGALSKAIGQKKSNKNYLLNKYKFSKIRFTEFDADEFTVSVDCRDD